MAPPEPSPRLDTSGLARFVSDLASGVDMPSVEKRVERYRSEAREILDGSPLWQSLQAFEAGGLPEHELRALTPGSPRRGAALSMAIDAHHARLAIERGQLGEAVWAASLAEEHSQRAKRGS